MAFFSNSNNDTTANSNSTSSKQPMAKQNGNVPTPGQVNMIGEGAVLEGTLKTEGDVRISGRHIGKLKIGGKVSIAQEGAVEGEIYAASADISGRVNGDLHIDERLLLRGTAQVEGNISATRLIMEEGAVFNGKSQIGPEGAKASSNGAAEQQANASAPQEAGDGATQNTGGETNGGAAQQPEGEGNLQQTAG